MSMSLEYDLVIIGASPEGIYAAHQAIQYDKRIALVDQGLSNTASFESQSVLSQITQFIHHYRDLQALNYFDQPLPSQRFLQATQQLPQYPYYRELTAEKLANLAALGVDVLLSAGSFSNSPHLGFVVDNRHLRSRSYLLATGSRIQEPNIPGLKEIGYLTPETFYQAQLNQAPQIWTIIGATPTSLPIAQYLASLNQQVILLTQNSHILPQEDPDLAHLLQAHLEAMGIQIIPKAYIQSVKQIKRKSAIALPNQIVETDRILLATGYQIQIDKLNLEDIQVNYNDRKIITNHYLQTSNPNIYACGNLLGGYQFSEIAEHEAKIAVNNALFSRKIKINYASIPYQFSIYPNLGSVGLNERQAQQQTESIRVIKICLNNSDDISMVNNTKTICKFIIDLQAKILGVHFLGNNNVTELMSFLNLAIQHNLKLDDLIKLPPSSPMISELLHSLKLVNKRDSSRKKA